MIGYGNVGSNWWTIKKIQGSPEADHYNGPHGFKLSVANISNTVINCIIKCNARNKYFSKNCHSEQ